MHFVVALLAEARPLIDRFVLRACGQHRAFTVFSSADGGTHLIVSGIGKVRAAAATAYLHAATGANPHNAWLNIGIAGHASRPLGTVVRSSRITDAATGCSWYPPQVIKSDCAGAEVICVDRVEESYHGEAVYDMESAGFYPTAARFSNAEVVQCCKIVSDNLAKPAQRLRAADVESIIASRIPEIAEFALRLQAIECRRAMLAVQQPDIDTFAKHWHFTVSQQHRLRRVLWRWSLLAGDAELWDMELTACADAAAVLRQIEQRVEALPVVLSSES
ncbi:MAG: hypothetical protein OEQ39_12120 [Gammaproteobacteria bacterium]|nr:hypothetical protein [Gammaproteobacteria bacterium]MDH3465033.1 hypothetical protein [Gammaproteobacteria bacterium]